MKPECSEKEPPDLSKSIGIKDFLEKEHPMLAKGVKRPFCTLLMELHMDKIFLESNLAMHMKGALKTIHTL